MRKMMVILTAASMISAACGVSMLAAEPAIRERKPPKAPNDPRVSRQVRRAQNRAASKHMKGNHR